MACSPTHHWQAQQILARQRHIGKGLSTDRQSENKEVQLGAQALLTASAIKAAASRNGDQVTGLINQHFQGRTAEEGHGISWVELACGRNPAGIAQLLSRYGGRLWAQKSPGKHHQLAQCHDPAALFMAAEEQVHGSEQVWVLTALA